MANSLQARKRVRQTARKTAVNRQRMSRLRTFVVKVETAIAAGEKDAAATMLRQAESELARGARLGVIHRNAASRKVSRLSRRIAKM